MPCRSSSVGIASCGLMVLASLLLADDAAKPKDAVPLATASKGMVVGTTGRRAVEAGREVLKQGGSAADAAAATALAQVVECGGAYVSHAGIYGMVYFDAASGKTHALNACYDIPLEEKDPQTIPKSGTPSGRTVLVPGFMAGVLATHERFGKPSRLTLHPPAGVAAAGHAPLHGLQV